MNSAALTALVKIAIELLIGRGEEIHADALAAHPQPLVCVHADNWSLQRHS